MFRSKTTNTRERGFVVKKQFGCNVAAATLQQNCFLTTYFN